MLVARAGQLSDDPRIVEIANAGRITTFNINCDPAEIRELIRRKLFLYSRSKKPEVRKQ